MGEADRSSQFLLQALALSRQGGAPPLACLAGVRRLHDEQGAVALGLTPLPDTTGAVAGLLEVAMLADLALGAAGRAKVGVEAQLPTVSLTVQLTGRLPGVEQLLVRAHEPAVQADQPISTSGMLLSGPHLVGHCLAQFATGGQRRLPALPWERAEHSPPEPIGDDQLDGDERAAIEVILRTATVPPASALLLAACSVAPEPPSPPGIELRPTRLLTNRGGTVQGGALFALAAHSAMQVGQPRLSSGHIQFLAAADIGAPVLACSELLRAGRRTAFVRTDLRQGGELVASAAFVLLSSTTVGG